MKIISDPQEMQQTMLQLKKSGKKTAFVPTMGLLHAGHASLLREGRARSDILVLSIFVNPTQFGPNEDLDSYPRNLAGDCEVAESCGTDYVFAPAAKDIYPENFQTSIRLAQLPQPLCGASRPGHFDGVAVVVCKLFNIVQPDLAFFGKKDFQQLAIIRQMVKDLNMPLEIIGMPIVREKDGLALSSRNSYLSPSERKQALCLYHTIMAVRKLFESGERSADRLLAAGRKELAVTEEAVTDYLELRNSKTLQTVEKADHETLLALAVKIGKTRLIDNSVLGEEI